MLLYEIDKSDVRKRGSYKAAITAGDYVLRDEDFMRRALNFGNGTEKDMNRYMRDNAVFCVWIDARTMHPVKHI